MEAVEYLKHWKPIDKDRLLRCAKHQRRFEACTGYLSGNNFVDIGCAEGHSTYHMKTFHPGSWTGVDFCKDTIGLAAKNFTDIDFKYIDKIESLPKLGKFDGVICSEVIEHVENDGLLVEKLIEITNEVLIITTPSRKVKSIGHLRLYDLPMLSTLFSKYSNVKIIKEHPFFYVIYEVNRHASKI